MDKLDILSALGIYTRISVGTSRYGSWKTMDHQYRTWAEVQAAYPSVDSWATFGKSGDEVWFPAAEIADVRRLLKSEGSKIKCHIGTPCAREVHSHYGGWRPCGRPITDGGELCAVHSAGIRRKENRRAERRDENARQAAIDGRFKQQAARLAEFGISASVVRTAYGTSCVAVDADALYDKLSEAVFLLRDSGIKNHPLRAS